MTAKRIGLIVLACLLCSVVAAQSAVRSVEAERYTTSNGVEIFQNRSKAIPKNELKTPSANVPASLVDKRVQPQIRPVSTSSESILQGSKSQLASESMKNDRRNILTSELMVEVRELEAKRKLLKSPRGTNDLVDKMYTRLEREVEDHQDNIRALTREIRREHQR